MTIINNLRRSIFCIFVIALITGCSRYQYVLVGSRLPQNENQEYIVENDTVRIKYSFAGENLPLTISVFNKLAQPVYFDLQRTTVIINDVQTEVPNLFEGQSDFIAPLATASFTSISLRDQLFSLNVQDSIVRKPKQTNLGKVYSFDEGTSPLYLRVILALSTNEDYSFPTFYDYSFWVSDIIQNASSPKNMNYKPSNQFYVSKTTAFGKAMYGTGAVMALIVAGLLGLEWE